MKVSQAIGNTPLIKITDQIYAKLETVNPSGSIKDRMALHLLNNAEKQGLIRPGGTIIEATSGNTGIAFSMLAAERGYKMIAVMPSDMSEERKLMIKAFGAEIVEVGPADFLGAVAKRDELIKELNGFCPNQFSNPENPDCHFQTTGQEILNQLKAYNIDKPIVAVVAGVGTGGTLMGLGKAIKAVHPNAKLIAVEPAESAVMSNGPIGPHPIQGIGDGFIPEIVKLNEVDEIMTVLSDLAVSKTRELATKHGLLVGISSGANIAVAERFIEVNQSTGIVVTVLPDRQERYLSLLKQSDPSPKILDRIRSFIKQGGKV